MTQHPDSESNQASTAELVMGFDFGTRRIGVAVGQTITASASAQKPVSACDGIPAWEELDSQLHDWQPQVLVVGLPLNMDGTLGEQGLRARKFANRLQERYRLPCFLVDERLTTRAAKEEHRAMGGSSDYRKHSVDGIAAQLILESWFEDCKRYPSDTPLKELPWPRSLT